MTYCNKRWVSILFAFALASCSDSQFGASTKPAQRTQETTAQKQATTTDRPVAVSDVGDQENQEDQEDGVRKKNTKKGGKKALDETESSLSGDADGSVDADQRDDSDGSMKEKASCNVIACLDDGNWKEASAMVFIPACAGKNCVSCNDDGGITALGKAPLQRFSGFPKESSVIFQSQTYAITSGKEIGSDDCPAEIIIPQG